MVPDFSKFFAEISLSRHGSTKPRLSCDSWSQKTYVHIGETFGYKTLRSPALIFWFFHFWSSIAPNSVHVLTNQVYILTPQVICYHYLPFDFSYFGFWSSRYHITHNFPSWTMKAGPSISTKACSFAIFGEAFWSYLRDRIHRIKISRSNFIFINVYWK